MNNTKIFPLTNACLQFIQTINSSPLSMFFRKPYKPQKDDDYFEIIKKPMDLSTVKKKLLNGEYVSIKQWESEVRLIFTNSILYNGEMHLLGGISLYFLKKLDKFMEKVENSNARNFEEKTKKLYSEVLKLLREMPAVDIEYMNDPIKEEIIIQGQNQDQQNEEIQIGSGPQLQSEHIIQSSDTSQIQNEKTIAMTSTQIQKEEIQTNENSQIQKEEIQTDIGDIPPEEMYPFRSLEFQSYGEFDKARMRKIKNGLNNLVPNNLSEIFMLIHNSDTDFRCANIKEIDVASMSRRTLIAIEGMVQNIENGNGNNELNKKIDGDVFIKKPQTNNQYVFVRPSNHSSVIENKMSQNSESSKESSGAINISIDINPSTMNYENSEMNSNADAVRRNIDDGINDGDQINSNVIENSGDSSSLNESNSVNNDNQIADISTINGSIANDVSEAQIVENNGNQTADASNDNESATNDAGDVQVVTNDSSQAADTNGADNSATKNESEIQKVENNGN